MPLRKWLILHVNKGKTRVGARVGLQDKILWKMMKNKSIVPVSYLLEAIQLQKEEEEEKSGNRQWQKPECYKNGDNMEGKCKQIRKSSQGKEYSYVYFVLRTTVDKINNWKQASIK